MARQTHPPPSSGLPGRLAGLGHQRGARPVRFRGDPRLGATDVAPTAPHATPPAESDRKSGPARFWGARRVRVALATASILSLAFHVSVSPWRLLPDRSGLELKDPDGELTIPIELLGEEPVAESVPPPPPEPPPPETDPNAAANRADGGPKPRPDAAAPDAATRDAEALAELDASAAMLPDGGATATEGGAPSDAGETDAEAEGGLVAAGDSGAPPGAAGPRDPGSMIGLAGLISAGTINVTLLVNISVIRSNPVGARMGPLLYGIPQWNDFMKGSQATVDPIRDTDWILIYGPSLIHTDRDAVIVHYSAPDRVVDLAVQAIAKRYDKGGAFDAGVAGVKASLGHADNAERVFMRVQPHVLTIVPKDKATDFAKVLKRAPIAPRVRAGEAMRLTIKDPWKQIAIKNLKFNQALHELRLWIIPRAGDGGADLYAEGDCTDEGSATEIADALTEVIRRQNSLVVRAATRGMLNSAKVVPDGSNIKMHLAVSQEQLEAILQGVAAVLGVEVELPDAGAR